MAKIITIFSLRNLMLLAVFLTPLSLTAHEQKYGYSEGWEYCSWDDLISAYPAPERARELRNKDKLTVSIDQFVEEWQAHFQVLHRRVPHASPRENDWVENEISNGRYLDIRGTVEYAKYEVENWIHLSQQLLNNINASNGDERKYHLIHFGYRMTRYPADEFNILRENNIISDLRRWDDVKGRYKSFDENFIPSIRYDLKSKMYKETHQFVELGIEKCFLAR